MAGCTGRHKKIGNTVAFSCCSLAYPIMGRNAHWNEIIRKDCVEGPFRGAQTSRPCVCVCVCFSCSLCLSILLFPFRSFFFLFSPSLFLQPSNKQRGSELRSTDAPVRADEKKTFRSSFFTSHVRVHFDSSERFNLLSATCGPSSRSLDLALILLPVIYEIRSTKFIARAGKLEKSLG